LDDSQERGIITIVLLIIYWRGLGPKFGPNAVWGGLAGGLIIGFIFTIFLYFQRSGFDWYIIGKAAILGTMLGFIAELLGKAPDFIKKRR